jgi:hypothetical protein
MDIKLSLGGIQDLLTASLEVRDFVHNSESDGGGDDVISTMAYIPKFKTSGWPQSALNGLEVGGFWVDVHKCSQPDASSTSRGTTTANTPGDIAACSRPGVVPWTDINWQNARIAASNRVIQGRNCHLITPFERFAIFSHIMASGNWGNLRGNNNNGKDIRDAAEWKNYGILDPVKPDYRTLCGTGPASWWSSGVPGAGLADLVGNIYEFEDCRLESGLYQPKAYLNGAASVDDTSIEYDDNGGGDGVDICQLTPGTYTITDAGNGDEDVVVERVLITGRFSGILILSSGLTLDHGDDCEIQLKTAVDVTSVAKTGLELDSGSYLTIYSLLEDATEKYMALPDFSVTSDGYSSTYLDSGYAYENEDSRVLTRCGYWHRGPHARSGLFVDCRYSPSTAGSVVGFRAALSIGSL